MFQLSFFSFFFARTPEVANFLYFHAFHGSDPILKHEICYFGTYIILRLIFIPLIFAFLLNSCNLMTCIALNLAALKKSGSWKCTVFSKHFECMEKYSVLQLGCYCVFMEISGFVGHIDEVWNAAETASFNTLINLLIDNRSYIVSHAVCDKPHVGRLHSLRFIWVNNF